MKSDLSRYIPLLTRIFMVIFLSIGIYFLFTTLFIYLLPFIIGWMIASTLQPIIHFLTVRWKIPRNISTLLSISLFVAFIGGVLALIGGIIIIQLTKLSNMLPQFSDKLYSHTTNFVKELQVFFIQLPPDLAQAIVNGLNTLGNKLTDLLGLFITSILSFLTAIPSILISIIVTILSAYFMAKDRRKILRFIAAQIPSKTLSKGIMLRNDLIMALFGYLRAQLILMTITFVESAIGLTLIGIDYSLVLALIASIIDAFPILGTGSVYIPLIIWKLLIDEFHTAMLLAGLYGIIIIVRQLLEPKVLGSQIGIYPLVTLMSLYLGIKIFGFWGLIIGPVIVIILMAFQKVDILPRWRK